jgi:hypothetical protein
MFDPDDVAGGRVNTADRSELLTYYEELERERMDAGALRKLKHAAIARRCRLLATRPIRFAVFCRKILGLKRSKSKLRRRRL